MTENYNLSRALQKNGLNTLGVIISRCTFGASSSPRRRSGGNIMSNEVKKIIRRIVEDDNEIWLHDFVATCEAVAREDAM